VADWMYERLAKTYLLDEENQKFLTESNPWALHGIAERLLEAAERNMWQNPDEDTLGAVRALYLKAEGDIEHGT
jgi:cobaltochelatase CobN